jgi:uncharacterized protein YjeT (DUF2065 family)
VGHWTLLFVALGLTLFLEGLPYFISPSAVRRYMTQMLTWSDGTLRTLGLTLMIAGLIVAWLSVR